MWVPTYSRTFYLHLLLCELLCTPYPTQDATSTLPVLEASKLLRFGAKVDFLWVPWPCLQNISHLSLRKPGCHRVPPCPISSSYYYSLQSTYTVQSSVGVPFYAWKCQMFEGKHCSSLIPGMSVDSCLSSFIGCDDLIVCLLGSISIQGISMKLWELSGFTT